MNMPITIDWLNDKKNTSHIKFIKPWTWEEFYGVFEKGRQMIDSVSNRVNIVMDFTESGGMLPPSALTHFKKAAERAHPRRGVIVFVSKRIMLVKSLVNVVQKIVPRANAMLFADNIEEAKAIIDNIVEDKSDTLPLR
jgi:hypothetical protein